MASTFVTVSNGDIDIEVAVEGDGPLILCVHGWPELWYSWRHQMGHFAGLGYKVAAVNVRGYGGSSAPAAVEAYAMREIMGDMTAVIDALGEGQAIVWGHDWGAPIAWNTARFHADKVTAVAGPSLPYRPTGPDNPLDLWRALYTDQGRFFYQIYFQEPGVAEAELGADTLRSIRLIYYAASGDAWRNRDPGRLSEKPADEPMLVGLEDPDPFPSWCSSQDLQIFADGIDQNGWHGLLNRYRAQPIDAQELGSVTEPGPNIRQPAAFIGGEFDPVRGFATGMDLYSMAGDFLDDFRGSTLIEGAGHWVQQEDPEATNAALETFLHGLD